MPFVKRLNITIPILWLGFVLSISFMEAWLKFRAEGVTQATGLSIGRLVFGALNKVELFFMTVLLVSMFKARWFIQNKVLRNLLIALGAILLIQTVYLLPALDQRAMTILQGGTPPASYFHFYYVFLEVLKVIFLGLFSHRTLTKNHGQY